MQDFETLLLVMSHFNELKMSLQICFYSKLINFQLVVIQKPRSNLSKSSEIINNTIFKFH